MHDLGICDCGRNPQAPEGEQGAEWRGAHCRGKACCLWFVSREQVRRHTPPGALSADAFLRPLIDPLFCPVCAGTLSGFGLAADGQESPAMPLRRLEALEPAAGPRLPFDERSLCVLAD